MTSPADRRIEQLSARQEGHLTRSQAVEAGLHRNTVARRIRSGQYVLVGHQTMRLAAVARSRRGEVVAACLDLGGIASHWTAAWLHGLAPRRSTVDVTVLKGRRVDAPWSGTGECPPVRVHNTTSLPAEDIHVSGAIPMTSVARTALGLAGLVPSELAVADLSVIVGAAVDARLATDPWLWWLLAKRRCRGRNGVTNLETVLAERARLGPTESWLEREVLRVLGEAGLPMPRTQQVVRRSGRFAARVDFSFAPSPVVLEALGYAYHRTPAQLAADLARANELQLLGFEVYQFTASQIVGDPAGLVATVERALGAHGRAAA